MNDKKYKQIKKTTFGFSKRKKKKKTKIYCAKRPLIQDNR